MPSSADPIARLTWNVGLRTDRIPHTTGETSIMATLAPFDLVQPGVVVTQATDPVPCNVARTVTIHGIMDDATILDDSLAITKLAVEHSFDDGLNWSPLAGISWNGDSTRVPNPDLVPPALDRPGLLVHVPTDGKTRRFRARLDVPQAILVGIDLAVS